MKYLRGYAPELLVQVQALMDSGRLAETVARRHAVPQAIRTERARVDDTDELKQREHDRAFCALCQHMEPDYHQLEFDLRLWLTVQDQVAVIATGMAHPAPGSLRDAPARSR